MKKVMGIAMLGLVTVLCSCNGKKIANNSGVIDCYSINVNGTSLVYSVNNSVVYEYKDEKGNYIYTDYCPKTNSSYSKRSEYDIRVFDNKYSTDYTEYSYVGFVGYLEVESNYYLDLDNMVIDVETNWVEYLYDENPSTELKANNKKAYECAKKNYYHISNNVTYPKNGESYCSVIKNMVKTNLEDHTYIKLSENQQVTYVPKWFE